MQCWSTDSWSIGNVTFSLNGLFWFLIFHLFSTFFTLLHLIPAAVTKAWFVSDWWWTSFYFIWTLNWLCNTNVEYKENKRRSNESKHCLTAHWASRFSLIMQVKKWLWLISLMRISFFREMSKNIRLPVGKTLACSFFFISTAQKLLALVSRQMAFYLLYNRFHLSQWARKSLSPPGILIKTLQFNSWLNQGAPQRRCRNQGNTRSVVSCQATRRQHHVLFIVSGSPALRLLQSP